MSYTRQNNMCVIPNIHIIAKNFEHDFTFCCKTFIT